MEDGNHRAVIIYNGGQREYWQRGLPRPLGVMNKFYVLTVAVVIINYQTSLTLHLKLVSNIIRKLLLYKVD
jgi:hypothetical protein